MDVQAGPEETPGSGVHGTLEVARVSRILRIGLLGVCLAALAASPAAAAKPSIETIPVGEFGVHLDDLSTFCGFDVWVDVTGHIGIKVFTDRAGNTWREVDNYLFLVHYYSENASVDTVNVGPDRITYNADGSVELYATGNIESLHGPGAGNPYRDVGWTHFHVTFDADGNPTYEFVNDVGQHYG